MKRRKKKHWSYNAGERGRNWVRAFRQGRDGKYYLEWFDEDRRRRAALLRGVTTPLSAKAKADELAARFAQLASEPRAEPAAPALAEVLDRYEMEVTPSKGRSKQAHDRRARRVWLAFLDAQPEAGRRNGRRPESLDRIDWDRFVAMRRAGTIPGWPRPVKDGMVGNDLGFLVAVLNWAVGAGLAGSNPWSADVRRGGRWETPKERNPRRPGMTDEIRAGLIAHAPGNWRFAAMLWLGRETARRNSAIRRLRWSDINLRAGTIRWRAETDKAGRENVTPMTAGALEVVRTLPRGIGDAPVFPGRDGAVSRGTCQKWLRRAKARWMASVPSRDRGELRRRIARIGFHAEKRAAVRDRAFRNLPASVQEQLAGTNFDTLRRTYDEVTVEDMQAYLGRASGGDGG